MIVHVREVERVEARVLGAVRFVDAATGLAIETPLRVTGEAGVELTRNRSGLTVIRRHPDLAAHAESYFEAPATPALGSVEASLTVDDPSGFYLARRATVALPRDADPGNAANANSLFRAFDVPMYRSPSAARGVNWTALRVSLSDEDSGDALGGVLLRVLSNGDVLARGITDWRGEALVTVVGVAVMTWSENDDDTVIATGIDATFEAIYSEAHGSARTSAADAAFGRAPSALPAPDPESIESDPDAVKTTAPVHLTAGAELPLALQLDLTA
ncbi:MAG TPA: hypothetical protein VHP37_19795 [Burkholderiales bacterium]|nr:hypothetical protein [Burkholderiales bacterium]